MSSEFFFDPSDGYAMLEDIREGRVKMGLGMGMEIVDRHLRFKSGQFVMVNGHDNVGKTAWILWYFCVLSVKYGLTWDIYSAENSLASLKRDVMQFMNGKQLSRMSESEFHRAIEYMNQHFKFIRNDQTYTAKDILKISGSSKGSGLLIDPFNSLRGNGGNKHEEDYDVCGDIRVFCNKTKKSVYVNAHLVTEAARKKYPKDHDFEGHLMPPSKADTEGGQKFANRCDDFITCHRMTQHEGRKNWTEIHVRKVKETITGGGVTMLENPIIFKFWDYSRFEVGETDPIGKGQPAQGELQKNDTLNKFKDYGFDKATEDLPF